MSSSFGGGGEDAARVLRSAFGVLGNVGLYMGGAPAARAVQPRPRGALAVRRGLVARAAHRGIGRHGRRVSRRGISRPTTRRRRRAQKSSRRSPMNFCSSMRTPAGILVFQRTADALARIVPIGVSGPRRETFCSRRAKNGLRGCQSRYNDAALRKARRRPVLLQRSAVLQAVSRRPAGLSRRQCGRLFRHQRDRPAARPLPGERPVLRAAPRGQDALHAPGRPGAAAGLHDASEPARRVLVALADEHSGAEWFQRNTPVPRGVRGCTAGRRRNTTTSSSRASSSRRRRPSTRAISQRRTASGPPLPVLLSALEVLRDLRLAAPRYDIALPLCGRRAARGGGRRARLNRLGCRMARRVPFRSRGVGSIPE